MNSNSVNIPGGVNLTIAICALVGATLSIVGFFAHYVPHHQYRQFCETIQDVNIIIDKDWQSQLPDDLWFHYNIVSKNVDNFYYLVTSPWYLSIFNLSAAWRLSRLRQRASKLKIGLIALSQIKRSKRTISSDVDNTTVPEPLPRPSPRWWRWWSKTPSATTRQVVDV